MQLFLKYVRDRLAPKHAEAIRTEWEVFGENIDLAGSIDFVGVVTEGPDAGGLWLVDWKRTKELRKKKSSHPFGKFMLPPLDHVPDSSKWHYALPLNLYAYLLERYYGQRVVHLEVACFHPDNGSEPYYYVVPRLKKDHELLYCVAAAACGGSRVVPRPACFGGRGVEAQTARSSPTDADGWWMKNPRSSNRCCQARRNFDPELPRVMETGPAVARPRR